MSNFNNIFTFIQKLVEELAQDYDIQYQHMEEFARWNLPEEIALEWIDAEEMINVLECEKYISEECVVLLRKILNAFIDEFKKNNNSSLTHEAMKTSIFWNTQRANARNLLNIFNNQTK